MKLSRFATYAWGVLVYNIGVVLWGAFVRATGSGAGCGAHWPKCNGEVIPRAPSVETMIEFTHRVTSGIALLFVVGLLVWAFRAYPKGNIVRQGAVFSMVFIILEALLGAGLVLFELVAHNASLMRGASGALHLVNTFLLLAAITLTAWWASGGAIPQPREQGSLTWLFGLGIVGMLILGATGAITALGDTLFPASSLAEGLQQDVSPTAHLFVQLRVFHPLIAVLVGAYSVWLGWFAANRRPSVGTRRVAITLTALFGIQLLVGTVNVILLAPIWMQLVHLFLADLVWIALVIGSSVVLAQQPHRVVALTPAVSR
jgi:heme A synthase